MGKPSTQTTDGIQYVPKDIQNLLSDYQANTDSLSARQAVFSKLYNNGGDQQRLATMLANSDNAQGYSGLRGQIVAAYSPNLQGYTPQEAALYGVQQRLKSGKKNNNSVPNLAAVSGGGIQTQAANDAPQAGGVYQNLPQNSALPFFRDKNNQ